MRLWLPRQYVPMLTGLIILMTLGLTWAFTAAAPSPASEGQNRTDGAQSSDNPADVAGIRELIEKYTRAVDGADTALASEVWWNSPEATFIHPMGHEHGFEQIKQNVFTRLMGETFSERHLTAHDISIHTHGDSAWAEFYWDFAAKLRKDGSPVTTHGRETQIYWKIQNRWRLVHVHYSEMPAAAKR